jgi:CrcB protein
VIRYRAVRAAPQCAALRCRGFGVDAWLKTLVLSAGGVLGVNARYWLSLAIARRVGPEFPWATLLVNVSGALAAGFVSAALTARWPHPYLRLFLVAGFMGGYTTFSAFALEARALWEREAFGRAAAYVVGSVLAGLAAASMGAALAGTVAPAAEAPPETPVAADVTD